jgi:hypothetical protein
MCIAPQQLLQQQRKNRVHTGMFAQVGACSNSEKAKAVARASALLYAFSVLDAVVVSTCGVFVLVAGCITSTFPQV